MTFPSALDMDSLTLSSGRTLAWTVTGGPLNLDSDKPPAVVFYFHGGASSRLDGGFCSHATLQKHNARYINVDRPGIGHSTYYRERRVQDWPGDVLAIAEHLGIDTFFVMGISAGGPYALACAKAIPSVQADQGGRLRGAAVISSIYPVSVGLEGTSFGFRITRILMLWLPLWIITYVLDWMLGSSARNPDPTVLERAWDKSVARMQEMERLTVANEEMRPLFLASLRESFRQGSEGNALDMKLIYEWASESDLKDLDGRHVTIWHGTADVQGSSQMAERAAKAMPRAKATFFKGEAHLRASMTHSQEILASLLSLE